MPISVSQLNVTFGRQVAKARIVDLARQHPERVRAWAREQATRLDLTGYNYDADPKGVVGWDGVPREFAQSHPLEGLKPPENETQLIELVEAMLVQFKLFIEEQRGWALLWNDGRSDEKPESAAQLVFLGMAQHYLRLYGVELDREVELGRGPVDFKASSGSHHRLLIEIKKVHNGTFWNGLEYQLPSYMKSDQSHNGWFVAIRYRDDGISKKRVADLSQRVQALATDTGNTFRYTTVDARPKDSASKLKK